MNGLVSIAAPRIAQNVSVAMARVATRFYLFGALLVASTIYLPHRAPHHVIGLISLAVLSLLMIGLLSRFPWNMYGTYVFTATHVLASSAMVALLIYFTGGSQSGYHLLFFLIIFFSYYYNLTEMFVIATVVAVFYLLPLFYEGRDPYQYSTFAVTVLFFFFGTYLLSLVTRYMMMKNETLERLNGEIMALTSLSATLLHDLEEGSLPESLAENLKGYVPSTYCIGLLLDESNNLIVRFISPVRGLAWAPKINEIFPADRLVKLKSVFDTRQPLMLNIDAGDVDEDLLGILSPNTSVALAVPIRIGANHGGIVVFGEERIQSRAPFTNERIQMAITVSRQIATAIQLSRCYEKLAEAKHDLAVSHDRIIKAERLATLGEVTRAVEHEINNPLNVILNWAEVYQEDKSIPHEMRKKFQVIYDMAIRIAEVIRKLTDIKEARAVEFIKGQRMTDIH